MELAASGVWAYCVGAWSPPRFSTQDALPFSFDFLPVGLVVLLWLGLAAPVLWLGARAALGTGPVRQWVAITARTLLLLTMVLALGGLRWHRRPRDLDVIVLRDTSPSTSLVSGYPGSSLGASIDRFLHNASGADRKPPRDAIGTIRFDQDAVLESLPHEAVDADRNAGAIQAPGAGTDIAAALQLGLAAMRRLQWQCASPSGQPRRGRVQGEGGRRGV